MTGTTYSTFDERTEALDVAKAFPEAIHGRTILVTGVNKGGVGFSTSQAFASQSPKYLIIAGRSPTKVEECITALRAQYPNVDYRALKIDLSSQKSVRAAAADLLSWDDVGGIDIVVNNAAVMNLPERQLSEEGIELTFATNHIGHYLFTCLILPKLRQAAEGKPKGATRVVNLTSLSPILAAMRWSDINQEKVNKTLPAEEQPSYEMHKMYGGATNAEEKSYLPLEGYNQSKVANVLFSIALNKRLYERYGILSLACHPGLIETELSRYGNTETVAALKVVRSDPSQYFKTLGGGASTTLVSALDPKLTLPAIRPADGKENFGVFLMDCQVSDKANTKSTSSSEAERLWKLSEELVQEKFSW